MKPEQIAALLAPFDVPLSDRQTAQLAAYLELLVRWNARMNLTAVRDEKNIVIRHFGESLWSAARLLTPAGVLNPREAQPSTALQRGAPGEPSITGDRQPGQGTAKAGTAATAARPDRSGTEMPGATGGEAEPESMRVVDVGSGAGFPGLPLKIFAPAVQLTLIESQTKKAAFLKEVVRALGLESVEVYTGRAGEYGGRADLVTLRAVEKFESILPVAAGLLNGPGSRLALLIGRPQRRRAEELLPDLLWQDAGTVPLSADRILLVGAKA